MRVEMGAEGGAGACAHVVWLCESVACVRVRVCVCARASGREHTARSMALRTAASPSRARSSSASRRRAASAFTTWAAASGSSHCRSCATTPSLSIAERHTCGDPPQTQEEPRTLQDEGEAFGRAGIYFKGGRAAQSGAQGRRTLVGKVCAPGTRCTLLNRSSPWRRNLTHSFRTPVAGLLMSR